MEKNKTAVDWLVKELSNLGYLFAPAFGHAIIEKKIEEAKQMEKEQMLDCYLKADVFPRKYEFEQYYNETYGK